MKFVLALSLSFVVGCGGCAHRQVPPAVLAPSPSPSGSVQPEKAPPLLPLVASAMGTNGAVFVLRMSGAVDDESAEAVENSLALAGKLGVAAVVLEINSRGGVVDAGFEMAKAIEYSPVPVDCVVDGEALSMAYYVLQSCRSRAMTERSRLMAHNAYSVGTFQLSPGTSIFNVAERARTLAEAMLWQYSHRTKVPLKEFRRRLVDDREWWMTAPDALRLGAVDRIVEPRRLAAELAG